jgi:hypothetical protein
MRVELSADVAPDLDEIAACIARNLVNLAYPEGHAGNA